jgi:hypothetical protein
VGRDSEQALQRKFFTFGGVRRDQTFFHRVLDVSGLEDEGRELSFLLEKEVVCTAD